MVRGDDDAVRRGEARADDEDFDVRRPARGSALGRFEPVARFCTDANGSAPHPTPSRLDDYTSPSSTRARARSGGETLSAKVTVHVGGCDEPPLKLDAAGVRTTDSTRHGR